MPTRSPRTARRRAGPRTGGSRSRWRSKRAVGLPRTADARPARAAAGVVASGCSPPQVGGPLSGVLLRAPRAHLGEDLGLELGHQVAIFADHLGPPRVGRAGPELERLGG